jgi:hypothetical protein
MFYIYENWQAGPHKAKIHRDSCGQCKDGRGKAGGYDPAHAKWHGPFRTLTQARDVQRRMQVAVRSDCGHCMRDA